jgi:hypothetical protein
MTDSKNERSGEVPLKFRSREKASSFCSQEPKTVLTFYRRDEHLNPSTPKSNRGFCSNLKPHYSEDTRCLASKLTSRFRCVVPRLNVMRISLGRQRSISSQQAPTSNALPGQSHANCTRHQTEPPNSQRIRRLSVRGPNYDSALIDYFTDARGP